MQECLTLEPAPTLARSWYCADLLSRWTPMGWTSWRDCQTAGSLYAHQQRKAQPFSQRANVSCTPIYILPCRVGKWWELQVDPQNNGFPSWSGWTRELIGWRRESRRPRAWITVRLKPFFFFFLESGPAHSWSTAGRLSSSGRRGEMKVRRQGLLAQIPMAPFSCLVSAKARGVAQGHPGLTMG